MAVPLAKIKMLLTGYHFLSYEILVVRYVQSMVKNPKKFGERKLTTFFLNEKDKVYGPH